MSEKVTIQDIIELLAEKHSMTKKDAEIFVTWPAPVQA